MDDGNTYYDVRGRNKYYLELLEYVPITALSLFLCTMRERIFVASVLVEIELELVNLEIRDGQLRVGQAKDNFAQQDFCYAVEPSRNVFG